MEVSSSRIDTYDNSKLILLKRLTSVFIECISLSDKEKLHLCGHIADMVHNVHDIFTVKFVETTERYLNCKEFYTFYIKYAQYINYIFDAHVSYSSPLHRPRFVFNRVRAFSDRMPDRQLIHKFTSIVELYASTLVLMRNRFMSPGVLSGNTSRLSRTFQVEAADVEDYVLAFRGWLCALDVMLDQAISHNEVDRSSLSAFLVRCPPHLQHDFLDIYRKFR